jgi:hypothetical protein
LYYWIAHPSAVISDLFTYYLCKCLLASNQHSLYLASQSFNLHSALCHNIIAFRLIFCAFPIHLIFILSLTQIHKSMRLIYERGEVRGSTEQRSIYKSQFPSNQSVENRWSSLGYACCLHFTVLVFQAIAQYNL